MGCDPGQASGAWSKGFNLAWGSRWASRRRDWRGKGQESSKSNIEGDHWGPRNSPPGNHRRQRLRARPQSPAALSSRHSKVSVRTGWPPLGVPWVSRHGPSLLVQQLWPASPPAEHSPTGAADERVVLFVEVDAGDGAVSQGKNAPAKGLKTLVVLHVPHANILGGNQRRGQEWALRGTACPSLRALLGAQPLR